MTGEEQIQQKMSVRDINGIKAGRRPTVSLHMQSYEEKDNTMEPKELKIFISYGHIYDDNGDKVSPVVRKIVDRLEKRNHKIFLDVNELTSADIANWPNNDWRSALYKGIHNSDEVVGFLSEYALRQRGVCRDELSIAVANRGRRIVTVLLDDQRKMKIPPTISRIQWVDMSDWKEHYDPVVSEFVDDGYFDQKFSEIIERVEQEENFIYQYDINFLLKSLCPSDTTNTELVSLLSKESDKEGKYIYEKRSWLEKKIHEFIESDKHYLFMIGGPGYGKSQFLAHVIHNTEEVYAYYFIVYSKADFNRNCNLMLRTLAFELAAKMPEYRASLINSISSYPFFAEGGYDKIFKYFHGLSDKALFDCLFHCDSVHFIDGNDDVLIAIDALDEADSAYKNPIVDFLVDTKGQMPDNFKFIVTSRATNNITERIDYFADDYVLVKLDVEQSDDDVRNYLYNRLAPYNVDKKTIDILTMRCEKTFKYSELLVQSIEDGSIKIDSTDDIYKIPRGFGGLLYHYFSILFSPDFFEDLKSPLGMMVANGGGIEKSTLNRLMRMSDPGFSAEKFATDMRSFIVFRNGRIDFYHKALFDWLKSNEAGMFYIDTSLFNEKLLESCQKIVEEFNDLAESDYSDATGWELYMDSEANGFNYSLVKFVYLTCLKLMKKAERKAFKKNELAFIGNVLWLAYQKSDILFADEVFDVFVGNEKYFETYSEKQKFWYAVAFNTKCEIEIAKNNDIPIDSSVLSFSLCAKDCTSAIMYAKYIKDKFSALPNYPRLYASLADNLAFTTRLLDNKPGKKSAYRLDEANNMLDDLQKYLNGKDFEGIVNSRAHLFYHRGIINYDMKNFVEATASLEEAVRYIDKYDEDDKALGEELLALVLNQRAACYMMIAKQLVNLRNIKEANNYFCWSISDINKSLNLRIKIHGKYSFYTATAFENSARYMQEYEKSQSGFSKLSSEVYQNINEALKIKKFIFPENSRSTARSYMIKAWCLDADKNYNDTFFECIECAKKISPATYTEDAEKLLNNAKEYLSCHG